MGRLWPFVLVSVALGLDAYVIAGLLLAGRAGANPRRSLVWALTVFAAANHDHGTHRVGEHSVNEPLLQCLRCRHGGSLPLA